MTFGTPRLPSAPDVERYVLGTLMLDPEAVDPILSSVEAEDFHTEAHRRIFQAAADLRGSGDPLDRVTVAHRLMATGQIESVGGLGYLTELERMPSVGSADTYLRMLREKAILRKAVEAASALVESLCAPGAGVGEVRAAEDFLRGLTARAETRLSLLSLGEFLEKLGSVEAFLDPSRSAAGVVPTPWFGLNEILSGGGLKPGQLAILAARPGIGKSACASAFALEAAKAGAPVAFFSLEMSTEEIYHRMIASVAQISLSWLMKGTLSEVARHEAQRALATLDELPIRVDDTAGATVAAIVAAVRRQNARLPKPIALVVVDYLQLVGTTRKKQNRAEEVSGITRDLKLAAKQLRVPFLVLAQLNREVEKQDAEPELHHLRESGSIEQDADIVMFLHQSAKEKREAFEQRRPSKLRLLLKKQRNGPIGARTLEFNGRHMQLTEVSGDA